MNDVVGLQTRYTGEVTILTGLSFSILGVAIPVEIHHIRTHEQRAIVLREGGWISVF